MKDLLILVVAGAAAAFGIKSCADTEWWKGVERDEEARELAERTPHVIREVDGCKVYRFKADGREHYFTRCPDSKTTTDRSHVVSCGKACSRIETERITAE